MLMQDFIPYPSEKPGTSDNFPLDTKPVPDLCCKRDKHHSDFLGSADLSRCDSRNLKYYGCKLVTTSTLSGFPIFYDR